MSVLNISDEFEINRFYNGVKLSEPRESKYSIANVLKCQFGVYFETTDGVIQKANALNAENYCGFDSTKSAIGKKYFLRMNKNEVKKLRYNDNLVMKKNCNVIFEEDITQDEAINVSTLSIKMPWYNTQNRVIGLFGCSILLGKNSLSQSLTHIAELGLLIPNIQLSKTLGNEIDNVYLSKRQLDCAKLLLQGNKIKEIADRLNLSPRTIETYLDNMKAKLKCRNKIDLTIKLFEHMKKYGN